MTWGEIEPVLKKSDDAAAKLARKNQAEKEAREAELLARLAEKREAKSYLHSFAEVPEEERKRMLWLPAWEIGEAWLALHDLAERRSGSR